MARLTRANLKSEVTLILGNRDDLTTEIATWVAHAYTFITHLDGLDLPETTAETTLNITGGATNATLPSDFYALMVVRNTATNLKLSYLAPDEYWQLDPNAPGVPTHYSLISGTNIFVHPKTTGDTAQVAMLYRKTLPDIPSAGSALPVAYDRAIVLLATSYGFTSLNQLTRAAFYETRALRHIAGIVTRREVERRDLDTGVPVTYVEIR